MIDDEGTKSMSMIDEEAEGRTSNFIWKVRQARLGTEHTQFDDPIINFIHTGIFLNVCIPYAFLIGLIS